MQIEVRQITNRRGLKKFIYLPEKIHQNHPNWVPPIYIDEWKYFNPRKNKSFSYCDTILALAYQDGEISGRIMGIINKRYNEYHNEKTGRFSNLECWKNQRAAHALLSYVENWAREKGMNKIVGPLGFSDQDPEGFLIEGFEHRPTIATYYNFEFMIDLLLTEGYIKEVDYVVYKVNIPNEIPEFYEKIYRRIIKKGKFKLIEFSKRRQIKPYIHPIFRLMNESFSDLFGYLPLNEKEMDDLSKRYLPIIDPRFLKIVRKNKEVVGFILGIPNMNEGIRQAKGRLFPFGILKILRSAQKTKQLDLLLGAIKDLYQGRGIDVMLGLKTIESAWKAGYEYVDSHHELESNKKMRAEMERLGGKIYKRYRIFQKQLTNNAYS
jgi:GNAT superfamily N-acetyltransferase